MNIVVLDGYVLNPGDLSWEGFYEYGEVTVYDRTRADLVDGRIGDAEIILTNKTILTRETFEKHPKIRYVGVLATGYNVVDLGAAREHGVLVTNVPNYGTDVVSQFAIGLLLELCSHIGAHGESVKRGDWTHCADFSYWNHSLMELQGKTMGIIGMGRIGKRTADIARALGMKLLANNQGRNHKYEEAWIQYTDLDHLFAKSDVISLHCPLTEATREIIGKENISKMKDGVIIINTARGPLVNERDLAEALDAGKVSGAGLDVVSQEPIKADNPLLSAKNCIITPHIAWASLEARQRLMNIAVKNLKQFLSGEPVHVVND